MLNEFLKENRKSFPNYFRIGELKNYYNNNQLHLLNYKNEMVGFYVLENEKFKSLFIKKEYRKYSKEILKNMFSKLKEKNNLLTIAVNNRSKRVKNLALKNGFLPSGEIVQGKTHLLEIYEWKHSFYSVVCR